jgi:hypothetical protein
MGDDVYDKLHELQRRQAALEKRHESERQDLKMKNRSLESLKVGDAETATTQRSGRAQGRRTLTHIDLGTEAANPKQRWAMATKEITVRKRVVKGLRAGFMQRAEFQVPPGGTGAADAQSTLLRRLKSSASRPSMVTAMEGDADSFEVREKLAQSVQSVANSLKTIKPSLPGHIVLWMCLLLLALSVGLMVVLHDDPLVNINGPSAFGEQPSGWGPDGKWRDEPEGGYQQHFDVNDPVAAFLSVTGLVYALVFASAYTEAQSRLDEIRRTLVQEA